MSRVGGRRVRCITCDGGGVEPARKCSHRYLRWADAELRSGCLRRPTRRRAHVHHDDLAIGKTLQDTLCCSVCVRISEFWCDHRRRF